MSTKTELIQFSIVFIICFLILRHYYLKDKRQNDLKNGFYNILARYRFVLIVLGISVISLLKIVIEIVKLTR
jgi:magnesium-transporting ATPase (P-type)